MNDENIPIGAKSEVAEYKYDPERHIQALEQELWKVREDNKNLFAENNELKQAIRIMAKHVK